MTTASVNYAPKASPELVEKLEALLPKLNRTAVRRAHDHATADDLHQAAVERILRTCDGSESERIIFLRGLSAMRNKESGSNRNAAHIQEPATTTEDQADYDDALYSEYEIKHFVNPEDALAEKEMFESAMRAINSLPEENREILSMVFRGVSQVEIAVKLGVTPAAVSQRISRIGTKVRLSLTIG